MSNEKMGLVASVDAKLDAIGDKLKKKEEEAPAAEPAPPEPSNEEKLLTEIRDLLKEQK